MTDTLRFSSPDDVTRVLGRLPVADEAAASAARTHQDRLTKPPGSLGLLEDLAEFMAGWQRNERPRIDRAQLLVFAGNHGVCAQRINPFPQEVTSQMVANFEAGGAAVNQLAELNGAELAVVSLELDRPTADFTAGPAMSDSECLDAMSSGAAAVDPAADILALGEMGIGNSTVAAALCHALFGGGGKDWTGRGTGSDASHLAGKISVVERGVGLHGHLPPIEILAALGGREQAAICGAVLQARVRRVPVILDGFICCAAVAPLYAMEPRVLAHCLAGHLSSEAGHGRLLKNFEMTPMLDLGMRLGEGSGAALALGIVRSALACHNGMATFEEAGVSGG
jgi:nicotinate-nucleotide--dimethylbenzimidazole phosphoribosyltransferase